MAFTPPAAAGPLPRSGRPRRPCRRTREAKVRHGQAVTSILVVVAGALVLGVSVHAAAGGALPAESASPSPSATPTASPSPVVPPANAGTVRRALRQRRAAVAAWR